MPGKLSKIYFNVSLISNPGANMDFLVKVWDRFVPLFPGVLTYLLFLENYWNSTLGPGFNDAWTAIKPSASCVEPRQDDYIKGICSPEVLSPNPVRYQLDRSALVLHPILDTRIFVRPSVRPPSVCHAQGTPH